MMYISGEQFIGRILSIGGVGFFLLLWPMISMIIIERLFHLGRSTLLGGALLTVLLIAIQLMTYFKEDIPVALLIISGLFWSSLLLKFICGHEVLPAIGVSLCIVLIQAFAIKFLFYIANSI
ncbi:MAG: hypothetical protein OCD01_14540 [Fibrobacterales bacterium]